MEDFVENVPEISASCSLGKGEQDLYTHRLSPKLRLAQGKMKDAAKAHKITQLCNQWEESLLQPSLI